MRLRFAWIPSNVESGTSLDSLPASCVERGLEVDVRAFCVVAQRARVEWRTFAVVW